MNVTQQGIITLLKSAVTGLNLELPKDFALDAEETKEIIKNHRLIMLVYVGAKKCGIPSTMPIMKILFTGYYKQMIRSEQQMKIVQEVFDAFDKYGIDYLPTKGCNMKALYPKPEMRYMGDADIFIREEQCPQIGNIMVELGFTKSRESIHEYTWDRTPLHLELHKRMISFYKEDYYDDVWSRAKNIGGNRYGFTTEDAFIHLFNHFARHYRTGGIGVRHVVDLYVYRKAYPQMNEEYIYQEMCTLHLQKFYKNMLNLLDVWFCDGTGDEVVDYITQVIFNDGNWGSLLSHALAKEVTKANASGKISNVHSKAIIKTLFPPKETMRINYKILDRVPFLLPLTWVLRGVKVLLFRRKNIIKQVRVWKGIEDETVREYQEGFKYVGLDLEQ